VLATLKALFQNPEREARRLNRDASAIIESTSRSFPIDRVRDIALMTMEHLGEAHAHLQEHSESLEAVLQRFKQLHGEARRRNEQLGLTAYTLVIIYLRAEALDARAGSALAAIDAFIGQWAHAAEES